MNQVSRSVAFLAVLLMVLIFLTISDGEYRHVARHFLSNLFRQLF